MTEFNQIEQKVAEYEMAKNEISALTIDEKVEEIKLNLMAKVLLDFLRIEDKLTTQPEGDWDEVNTSLYSLFHEKIDPEHTVDYTAITRGLTRSQKICDFFWDKKQPRIVDQLSAQSLLETINIKKDMESEKFKSTFHRIYFIPVLDRVEAFTMASKLQDANIKVLLPTDDEGFQNVRSQPRPNHLYSLSIEPVKLHSLVYSKNRSFADVAQALEDDNMCGLTIQEYLFWLADQEVQVETPSELQTILFDERFGDYSLLESRWEGNILKIKPTRNYNNLVPILALKGWGDLE